MSLSKTQVKNLLQAITTTIDDNVTVADIVVLYEGGPETLRWLFYVNDYDVVVTIKDPPVGSQRFIQDIPQHHVESVEAVVTTIDKAGVTGTKMQDKMRTQIRSVIEAGAQGTNYILRMPRERPTGKRKGGIDRVWEIGYFIAYWDA